MSEREIDEQLAQVRRELESGSWEKRLTPAEWRRQVTELLDLLDRYRAAYLDAYRTSEQLAEANQRAEARLAEAERGMKALNATLDSLNREAGAVRTLASPQGAPAALTAIRQALPESGRR